MVADERPGTGARGRRTRRYNSRGIKTIMDIEITKIINAVFSLFQLKKKTKLHTLELYS